MTVAQFYPSYEVALYTGLLLTLWFIVKLIATCMNYVFKYIRDHGSGKVDPYINNVKYPVSYWSERGGRQYQEDRFHAMKAFGNTECSLYGVFDGHGGYLAAQHCKDYLLQSIASDPEYSTNPREVIKRSFHRVDAEFSNKARTQMLNDGSTAVVAIIDRDKIYVANAGDSRAIIVQKGDKAKPMSLDHRPERKDEESRIRKLGGKLIYWGRWRVEGILAVSRAIGDVSLQPYVTSDPEIIEKTIDPEDEYLVLASDGLWDVMANEYVAKKVLAESNKNFLNVAKVLCDDAIILGSADNVTALVIDIKRRQISESDSKKR